MKAHTFLLLILFNITFINMCKAFDISSLLMDRRYVEKQISCVINRGYCDFMGKQIRGLFIEVLNNDCRQCTPGQVRQAHRLVQFMQRYYPNEWITMVRLYRPPPLENKHRPKPPLLEDKDEPKPPLLENKDEPKSPQLEDNDKPKAKDNSDTP